MVRPRASRLIVIALCLLAVTKFISRGPVLAWGLSQDFKTFYAASRAWSYGMNPYTTGG